MRWIWIDRIVEHEPGKKLVTVKNVSAAEEVVHDHFPAEGDLGPEPVMPNPLIVEGMAQTAGILVGHTGRFKEKVVLAKIKSATFHAAARPGMTLRHTATLLNFGTAGGSTAGVTELIDPHTGAVTPLAEIDLMFSHVDHNMAGLDFPEENFVFTGTLTAVFAGLEPMPESPA
ncbi:MAG: 3-hydroxyacyl-ACP dehydratase FabZ family protein [Planctomycetota bacterium]